MNVRLSVALSIAALTTGLVAQTPNPGGVMQMPIPQLTCNKALLITNNSGSAAACLSLTLDTGGSLVLPPENVIAPLCPDPTVQITGLQVDINWGSACIPAGATIVLYVSSTTPTLLMPGQTIADLFDSLDITVVAGNWTGLTGGNSGDLDTGGGGAGGGGDVVIVGLGGNQPGADPCVVGSNIIYVPQGPTVHGAPMPPVEPNKCWTKKCFKTAADCFIQILKDGQVISTVGTGIVRPPCMFIMRITNMPDLKMMRAQMMPIDGPSPAEATFGVMGQDHVAHTPGDHSLRSFRRDDDGVLRPTRDLPVLFDEIYNTLQIQQLMPGPIPRVIGTVDGSYSAMIALLGPRFVDAGAAFGEIAQLMTAEAGASGDVRYDALAMSASGIESSLTLIGGSMNAGGGFDAHDFELLESALTTFGATLASFEASPSDSHAQSDLRHMALGVHVARDQVLDGLDDTLEQDAFLWGLQNTFAPMFRHLADSLVPHTRVQVDLGAHGWFPSTIMGVLVRIQDADTDELLDMQCVRLSDTYAFDVVGYAGRDLRVWFKVPGYVSEVVSVPAGATTVDAGLLRCGDA
ncbi:MAG: hypothetical protein AAF196_20875, partial [Planctomycetota bacterium]